MIVKICCANRIFLFLLSYILIQTSVFAQIKIQKTITADDGLVMNRAKVMCQDGDGYLWFGTYNGLSKWDGNNFENFQNYNGLTVPYVWDIKEAPDKSLNIATYGGGIIVYNGGIIDTLNKDDGLFSNFVSQIHFSKSGKTYIGCGGKFQIIDGDKITEITDFPKSAILDSYEEDDETLYIASQGKGLIVFQNNSLKIFTTENGLTNNSVTALGKSPSGEIVVGTLSGINKFKDGKVVPFAFNDKTLTSRINDITVSREGTIYYATDKGVIVENPNGVELITEENGLANNFVECVYEDNNGTIYFGTNGYGVSVYHPGRFTNYSTTTGLPFNDIIGAAQNKNGDFFFAIPEGLIIKRDNPSNDLEFKFVKSNSHINSMYQTPSGKILFGTNDGVMIFENERIKSFIPGSSLPHQKAFSLKEINGELFISTFMGVAVYKEGRVKTLDKKNGLPSNFVTSFLLAKDSTIFFGTHGKGLSSYKNGTFTNYTKESFLSDGNITALEQSANGSILIGTEQGGLNIYRNGKVTVLDVSDGLTSNTIHDIAEGSDGSVYLATLRGLNVVNFNNCKAFVRSITKSDGLLDNECYRLFIDSDGNVWIGAYDGLTKYNPVKDKKITQPPKVYFTGFEIHNETFPLSEFIDNPELDYDQNYLKFTVTEINMSAPKKILYKYRLSGVDKNWVTRTESSIQYTNLDNGKYDFEAKAQNEWGYWSEPVKLSFLINPAWWETWQFYALLFIAIGSLIAFAASYRYRNLLALEKIRTKISADLHDSIGSGLSEITILSELLTATPNANPNDIQNGLKSISVTARSLVGNMSDIVWLVNPHKDSLKDLLLRLQDSYRELLSQMNVSFEIINIRTLEEIHLSMTFRQHLFLIFKEALNNSLKYSGCKSITMKIETKAKRLVITFSDDGKGFDMEKVKKGNGLNNMKKRAEIINGKLEFYSKPANGTTIIFSGNLNKLNAV